MDRQDKLAMAVLGVLAATAVVVAVLLMTW
jgi:hypothetical protein